MHLTPDTALLTLKPMFHTNGTAKEKNTALLRTFRQSEGARPTLAELVKSMRLPKRAFRTDHSGCDGARPDVAA